MPGYKRKARAGRSTRRPRKVARHMARLPARRYRVSPNVLRVARKFWLTQWTWGTTTTNDFWRYVVFTPANIPNFAEYAAVFDMVRINALKFTYRPRYTDVEAAGAGPTTGTPTAYAHVIVDPESTLIPSGVYGSGTVNTLLENTRAKTYGLHRPFSVYYKPKVMFQVDGSGSATAVRTPPWLRTSDTSTVHRGHHMYIQQNAFSASANANIQLDVFVTVYMTLKNMR